MKRMTGMLWLAAVLAAAAASLADEGVAPRQQPTPRTGMGDVKKPEAPAAEPEGDEKGKGPFDGLKLRSGDGLPGLEPRYPAVARHVQEDAASDDAVRVVVHVQDARSPAGDIRGRQSSVQLSIV